jgi:phosphomannomutase
MRLRIGVAVERRDAPCAESLLQLGERGAAGVAQHEIECAEPVLGNVFDHLARTEPRERHGRVEIVEDAQRRCALIAQESRGFASIRAVRGDDHRIGIPDVRACALPDVVPLAIENELGSGQCVQVAMLRVVRDVALEEDDIVPAASECANQATPQRRMSVAPRRAERQAENGELHAPAIKQALIPRRNRLAQRDVRVRMLNIVPRINPAAVRSYDLRGVVGRELGPNDAHALGLAFATAARAQRLRSVAVGRDGRESSPLLEEALVAGLVAGGLRARRIGLGPTPMLYFAVHACGFDGGIMVTGSHNPRDENGFKLLLGAEPVYGAALRKLVSLEPRRQAGGAEGECSVTGAYLQSLAHLARAAKPFKVVWDCGSGALGAVIEELTQMLPGRHVLLNARVDGRFPAHHPDPSIAANLRELQAAVVAHGADLGIAFDGDGDRIGVVDETGAIVLADQLLLLLAADALERQPGAAIVADVKSSRVLFEGIRRLGGRAVMAPSGYVLVRAAMLAAAAPLAGEMSGHIMFAGAWHGSDDALYVAMRLLQALTRFGASLAEFRRALLRTIATPELRIACPAVRKHAVIREVALRVKASGAQIDTTDGVRVTNKDGWWLLRASGTESKLTARCEAGDEDSLARLRSMLIRQLRASGIDLP